MSEHDTKKLLKLAQNGDNSAAQTLLQRHREPLKRMIAVFLDRRVRQRVDPSDIVQETLIFAARKLPELDAEPAGGFYPWLREIARERIVDAHRRHVHAGKRTVRRETGIGPFFSNESTTRLAERLAAIDESPSGKFEAAQRRSDLTRALAELDETDRDLLLMRYAEQLKVREIAGLLSLTESAVKSRLCRALVRLGALLNRKGSERQ